MDYGFYKEEELNNLLLKNLDKLEKAEDFSMTHSENFKRMAAIAQTASALANLGRTDYLHYGARESE